jgi:tryptophan halogenase
MKSLDVAVLGGGTAGFMAAAHVTRHFPDFRLHHIYDSRIPAIGVGEGTTPPFARWLHETTGVSFPELQTACDLTRKRGIRFEDWGTEAPAFVHYFAPTREGQAYHISAARITGFLQRYVTATTLDRRVSNIESRDSSARIVFEDGSDLVVDLVFDARGFPPEVRRPQAAGRDAAGVEAARDGAGTSILELAGIPTNAALIGRSSSVSPLTATRAVARPHGWIFVIPLTTSTSYGYVHNDTLSTPDEIEADLAAFLAREGVEIGTPRLITFPNFSRRAFFDGVVFTIGNAAAFLEPLEATGLTIVLVQLRLASYWILDEILGISGTGRSEACLSTINEHMLDFIREAALFVSWHYACGSSFRTPFWTYARECFERDLARSDKRIRTAFLDFVRAGARAPRDIAFMGKDRDQDRLGGQLPASTTSFGGFLDLSFAKVGHGLGYFQQEHTNVPAAG